MTEGERTKECTRQRLQKRREFEANPEKVRAKQRERNRKKRENPIQRFLDGARNSMSAALRRNGCVKDARTLARLGCSWEEFRTYIEKKFQPGMTFENYGIKGWHIDHIRPCASFSDLSDPAQQGECFHYTNLQPLWAEDNQHKAAKYVPIL